MVNEKEKKDCCGCRACELACPKKAITMVEDEKGFWYPVIDESLCDQCGICDQVCGFVDGYKNHGDNPEVLAVKNIDEEVRKTSTSGGMFVAISDEVLQQDGVVYGAGYGEDLSVRHKRAETEEQRDEFKGSKYVQSDLGDTFLQVRRDLQNGRKVLFTGTPCQVSALTSFLRKDYHNLFTVDVLCHGTPSNKLWQEHLAVIEKVNKSRVIHVNFRDKTIGWHQPRTKIVFQEKIIGKIKGEQSYFQLFNPNYMLMPACHNCKFRNFARPSDMTIADFWGIEKSMPEFDDNKGVSLVLVNSDKGKTFLKNIQDKMVIKRSAKEHCALDQIIEPVPKNKKSDQFWREYQKHGMEYVLIKYTEFSDVRTFFRKAFRKIKRTFSFSSL